MNKIKRIWKLLQILKVFILKEQIEFDDYQNIKNHNPPHTT